VTDAEIAEALDGPLALAAVEAAKLRGQAWALQDEAMALMADADRALFTARQRVRLDQAQAALNEHQRTHKSLHSPRTTARKAEEKAAAELATATGEHEEIRRADEMARRYKAGVAAESEAAIRLDRASAVLARYKASLSDAAARRDAAETAFGQSVARGALLERARDEAAAALAGPGRIPLSAETVTAGGLRLLLRGELDPVELVIAGVIGRQICAVTGATEGIVAEARADLLREQDADKRDKPVHLRALGNGNVAVTPNLLNPSTPMPFHPPAPAAQ
jgi:hypothetical protein